MLFCLTIIQDFLTHLMKGPRLNLQPVFSPSSWIFSLFWCSLSIFIHLCISHILLIKVFSLKRILMWNHSNPLCFFSPTLFENKGSYLRLKLCPWYNFTSCMALHAQMLTMFSDQFSLSNLYDRARKWSCCVKEW